MSAHLMQRMFSGKMVNLLSLANDDVDILDIAHNLSMICRFNGATRFFYSVAQHSLHVAAYVWYFSNRDVELTQRALVHDATEAYIGDITRPLKYTEVMSGYRVLEVSMDRTIQDALKLMVTEEMDPLIKRADDAILRLECEQLFIPAYAPMAEYQLPTDIGWQVVFKPVPSAVTLDLFLSAYADPAQFFTAWDPRQDGTGFSMLTLASTMRDARVEALRAAALP